ncbi:hypothetical protein C8J57DRAFT_1224927 [Mycena rebaudengoi]|nr:hypothetical protein C8J57DRAFT_1224927 [Mycena rebaudengoi]
MAETLPTELRAQLAKIGKEEALLQSKLQLLAEKRRSILRKLDAVIYPVNTLPLDIMAEIFMPYVDTSFMEFSSFTAQPQARLATAFSQCLQCVAKGCAFLSAPLGRCPAQLAPPIAMRSYFSAGFRAPEAVSWTSSSWAEI